MEMLFEQGIILFETMQLHLAPNGVKCHGESQIVFVMTHTFLGALGPVHTMPI